MNKLISFTGVVLLIKEVIPTLEKEGIVYANLIKVETKNGREYTLRERLGLPIQDFVGKPIECILEVIKFEYFSPDEKKKECPPNYEKGEYMWSETGYKFIPELLEMIEGHQDDENYEYDEDEYDKIAGGYFNQWGVCGLGLDIYQDKPMVKTEDGVFLFNEYENEKIIEEWELGQTMYFRPKKILLRGIKPYEGKWEKHKIKHKYGVELEKGKSYVVGTPRFLEDR